MAEPKYQQIAEDLRRRIESADLPEPGQQTLPTEIELMERYDASRNTVRDAIKLLTARGLVETRPGQGTFVVEKIKPFVTTLTADPQTGRGGGEEDVYIAEVEAGGRTPTTSDPRVEMQRASASMADALRIKEGDQVVSRHYQRFIDGTPFSLQTSFYPMDLVQRGATRLIEATDIAEGTVVYLVNKLGIKQVGYRDSIMVRPPDETETSFFRLPADGRVPVFEIYRIAYDENGDRIRLTISIYPTDRNRLVLKVGEVGRRSAGQHDQTAATTKGTGQHTELGARRSTAGPSQVERFIQASVTSQPGAHGAGHPPWRTGRSPGEIRTQQKGGGHGKALRSPVSAVPLRAL